jgi:hypothetical protein
MWTISELPESGRGTVTPLDMSWAPGMEYTAGLTSNHTV